MKRPAGGGGRNVKGDRRIARDEATAALLLRLCRARNVHLIYDTHLCAACEQAFTAERRVESFAIAGLGTTEPTAYMVCRDCAAMQRTKPQIIAGQVEANIAREIRILDTAMVSA